MKPTLKDKLIREALDFYKIDSLLDIEDDDEFEDEDFDDEFEDEFEDESDDDFDDDFDDELGDDDDFEDDEFGGDDFVEDDEFAEDVPTNPNKEGMIRTVKGAYLVYKRATPESDFEELWIYNMGNVKSQTRIRNAILAGTDIDPVSLRSPDNEQTADIWSKGNVQYLHVTGLPN
jgi:hypothetical protein